MGIALVLTVLVVVVVAAAEKCYAGNTEFSRCRNLNLNPDRIYGALVTINSTYRDDDRGFGTDAGHTKHRRRISNVRSDVHQFPSPPYDALKNLKSERCRYDFLKFVEGLRNYSSWAIEMFDASSKLPSGLITANTYQFGNYDQCIGTRSPEGSIKGQYCLAHVQFSPGPKKYKSFYRSTAENEFSLDYNFYDSFLEKLKVTKDFTKKKRNAFYTGFCIPDSCSAQDAETLLNGIVQSNKFGYNVKINVSDQLCSTNEFKPISNEGIILGVVIVAIVLLAIACTVWDRTRKPTKEPVGTLQRYVKAFSLVSNVSKLSSQKSDGEVNVFNGMKFLSMILIVMGHRCMSSCGGPFLNPQFLEERYRRMQNILLLNGTLIVDTFFLIGGYLTFLTLFNVCKSNKKLNLFQIYVYRWLRIVPVYMLVVFFYGHLLEHVGTGPVWGMRMAREAERCRKNWWTNLLFVNNYVNTESLCMFQSWYVTCDMHFTLLAPLVVKVMAKSSRKGLVLLTALIMGSILTNFLITYRNRYDGVLRVYISTFEDLAASFTFNKVYIKTHHRATPYFAGMATAYIYTKLKQRHHRFSLGEVWIYSIVAAVCCLSAICGAWFFYIPGREYDALENALYAAFHRLLWAIGMSWIAIAGGTKAFGILEPFLAQKFFTPLSKLTYSTFLVHGAIQLYTTSTLRIPEYMSFPKLYWMTCGDVILSFGLAFLLHIFFEAPLKEIQTLLFSRKQVKNSSR